MNITGNLVVFAAGYESWHAGSFHSLLRLLIFIVVIVSYFCSFYSSVFKLSLNSLGFSLLGIHFQISPSSITFCLIFFSILLSLFFYPPSPFSSSYRGWHLVSSPSVARQEKAGVGAPGWEWNALNWNICQAADYMIAAPPRRSGGCLKNPKHSPASPPEQSKHAATMQETEWWRRKWSRFLLSLVQNKGVFTPAD